MRKIKRIQISLITTGSTFFEDVNTTVSFVVVLVFFFCCFTSLTIALHRSPPAFLESGKHLLSAVLQKPMRLKPCNQLQDGATPTIRTVPLSLLRIISMEKGDGFMFHKLFISLAIFLQVFFAYSQFS